MQLAAGNVRTPTERSDVMVSWRGTARTGALVVLATTALSVTGCTSDGTAHVTDGPARTPGSSSSATKSAGKVDLAVPGSLDVAKLGAGWATGSAGKVPPGLYEPCDQPVGPKAAAAKVFWFTAPGGYKVAVENAKLPVDASQRRAALAEALLGCGADEVGGAVITNAVLPRIASLDSVGAHISVDRNDVTQHQAFWAAADDNLLVSVLVVPPAGFDLPTAVLDAYAGRITQSAVKAALGQPYGQLPAPGKDDLVVPGGGPAGSNKPQPVPSSSGSPDVTGPIQLPDINEAPEGMDGPGASDGYRKPEPNEP